MKRKCIKCEYALITKRKKKGAGTIKCKKHNMTALFKDRKTIENLVCVEDAMKVGDEVYD